MSFCQSQEVENVHRVYGLDNWFCDYFTTENVFLV